MSKLSISFLVTLLLCTATGLSVVNFDDGNYHLVNYVIDDFVQVDYSSPAAGTHVEIAAPGGIAPGKGYGYIVSFGNSKITMSGGQLGWSLWCQDNSQAVINSGYISGELGSCVNSSITLNQGTVALSAVAIDYGRFNIAGGSIGRTLELRDHAQTVWSGGHINSFIMSGGTGSTHITDTCLITCVGSNFAVNGFSVGYGESARSHAVLGSFSGFSCLTGKITGTLSNGDIVNNTFYILGNSDIVFVPEPATLILLCFGGFMLGRHKRHPK